MSNTTNANTQSSVTRDFYRLLNARNGTMQAFAIGQLSRSDGSVKGIGKTILQYALDKLNLLRANIGCKAVRIDCHDELIPYYEENGFHFVKTDSETGLCQMVSILN